MSKIIKMTDQEIEKLTTEFAEALRNTKMSDGKVSYTKDFGKIERKANLMYTEIAWLKQCMLVNEFDKEVAWHGVARRGDKPDEFVIEDILVYPQEVTGATVNTDQEKYQTWLYNQPDEVFNNIRMQGHSHVNMSTGPSTVDTTLYEKFLNQLDSDMFYVFVIWNKRGEHTIKIYDLRENVLYETADIDVNIIDNDLGFGKFVEDAKAMVTTKTYQAPATPQKTSAPVTTSVTPKSAAPSPSETYMRRGKKKTGKYGGYNYYDNWGSRYNDDDYYNRGL